VIKRLVLGLSLSVARKVARAVVHKLAARIFRR